MQVAEYIVNARRTGVLRSLAFLDRYQGVPGVLYAKPCVPAGAHVRVQPPPAPSPCAARWQPAAARPRGCLAWLPALLTVAAGCCPPTVAGCVQGGWAADLGVPGAGDQAHAGRGHTVGDGD